MQTIAFRTGVAAPPGRGARRLFPLLLVVLAAAGPVRAQYTLGTGVVGTGSTQASGGSYALRGTAGQVAGGAASGGAFTSGQGFWYQVEAGGGGTVVVLARLDAFLEGPYDAAANAMSTALNTGGHLAAGALSHPYAPAPWRHGGTEAVPSGFFTGHPTVVDWVLVQLRTGDPAAPPMAVVGQRAALLLADGAIVDLDGSSPVAFDGTPPGPYYVAVFHRNHLPAMSNAPVDFTAGSGQHDFTAAGSAYGTNGTLLLEQGVYGLFAGNGAPGDGTTNERIQPNDDAAWQTQFGAGAQGYPHSADYTLNGRVQPDDQARWRANFARGAQSAVPHGN